ncbi:MAG: phosphoglycerate dehydrogenase [Oscillospiraceae bacterium]|nr:phosphoglycerate dehydrogenase [Oscillospiraceae bacterium]
MYNILTLNKISAVGLENFSDGYNCGADIASPDAILVRSASMHETELNKKTLAIARAGAGVNNIPIEKCIEEGVVVFNTPGANANAVKELVIAGLLLTSRKIVPAIDWAKTLKGNGDTVPKDVEKGKSAFAGPEIFGKTLGVVGLGAIGILVANAAFSLGMKVIGFDPFLSENGKASLDSHVSVTADINDIYAKSDYITLHLPLNESTRDLINKETLAVMKDNVRILNFARGELVNTEDIIDALENGKVSAYITDFPNDTLIGAAGVIAVPHLGASTPESEDNCAIMAVNQIKDFLENGNIKNSVNLPDVSVARTGKHRMTIIHKNVAGVVSPITTTLAKENVNIDNMVSKSKGEYSYTMIDTDTDVSAEAVAAVTEIDGVIRVRVIK